MTFVVNNWRPTLRCNTWRHALTIFVVLALLLVVHAAPPHESVKVHIQASITPKEDSTHAPGPWLTPIEPVNLTSCEPQLLGIGVCNVHCFWSSTNPHSLRRCPKGGDRLLLRVGSCSAIPSAAAGPQEQGIAFLQSTVRAHVCVMQAPFCLTRAMTLQAGPLALGTFIRRVPQGALWCCAL